MDRLLKKEIIEYKERKQKKESIQKFKETGDFKYIYQNKPYKAYFKHDMTYAGFTDLTKELLYFVIKHLIFLKIRNMVDIKKLLLHWFVNFSIKSPLC